MAGLVVAVTLPMVFDLGKFSTADEKRWQANVSGFTSKLAQGKFGALLQRPHPGVTTQWLAAPTNHLASWPLKKLPLVAAQIILILMITYVAWRLWETVPAILMALLLAYDPQVVAHIRIYAMDSLLALFTLLSLVCLLLWQKSHQPRYLMYSGAAAALAVLSKLPGIIIVPAAIAVLATKFAPRRQWRDLTRTVAWWLLAFAVTLIIVLPSLIVSPLTTANILRDFFASSAYQDLHASGAYYYLRTLIFFLTPVHMAALIALLIYWRYTSGTRRHHVTVLLATALFFILVMSFGTKKGDRYILPSFALFDAVTAIIGATFLSDFKKSRRAMALSFVFIALLAWQVGDIWRLHPYALAYVNPLTKPFFGERRLGWGEGLDLAADYLNAKPQSNRLKVASYYPREFARLFAGETVELHQWDAGNINYVVFYRAALERGADAWETDVWRQLQPREPEKIIQINNLDYVWIYQIKE